MIRVVFLFVALALAGCGSPIVSSEPIQLTQTQQSLMMQTITRDFLNPSGVQTRNIKAARVMLENGASGIRVCGEIKGQNAFGGYVGFQPFQFTFEEDGSVGPWVVATGEGLALILYGECENWGLPLR